MKRKLIRLSRRYVTALRRHLKQGPQARLQPARGLGRQAVAIGSETLDVARMHEEALARLESSGRRMGSSNGRRVLHAEENKRLGLLGMRERLEMVGANFTVTSAPGKGTTIVAQIPLADGRAGGKRITR